MPTYGYRCDACGTEFDVVQRMTDEPRASCPRCGADSRRLFYPAGIVFKGSGFYKTDSRSAGGTSSAAATPAAPAKAPEPAQSGDGAASPPATAPSTQTTASGDAGSTTTPPPAP